MSKLDVGVGDEFPLDAESPQNNFEARHHWRHHGHQHLGHHAHQHHHGLLRLPMLLIVGGLAVLIVAGKIPVTAAYGMIALGAALILALVFFRARHIRRLRA
jgi:hypothetical protein